jgi:hypothetical protein
MIQDVDDALRTLVRQEAVRGSDVDVAFDAPTKEWSSRRNVPTIDLYLYDIREDLQRRVPAWEDARGKDGTVVARQLPPRRFKLSYLVTAWTQRPEDEHRLLSALLSAFIRNPMIKSEQLEGTLAEPDLPVYIDVGQPPSQDRSLADVWSALGGELKPSLDVVVTAPIMIKRDADYGPPVLTIPSLGVASSSGPSEVVAGRMRRIAPATEKVVEQEEVLPRTAVLRADGKKITPGLAVRMRGVRSR